ncbi:MAG: hypothetical protein JW966_12535 [Anaerolineae bacterium]|nr:hypothetical protein [Anaerolineae bacterium]
MKSLRFLLVLMLLAAGGAAAWSPISTTEAHQISWLQVWIMRDRDSGVHTVEYRDSAGNTMASFSLGNQSWGEQAGGRLFGWDLDGIYVFDPFTGVANREPVTKPADTTQYYYSLSSPVPTPDGQRYAYSIAQMPTNGEDASTSWVYVQTVGANDARLIHEVTNPDGWWSLEPLGWSADGTTLLLHHQPHGIGGYILFWQYSDVEQLNVNQNTIALIGGVDGFSADTNTVAAVEGDYGSLSGLRVTYVPTSQSASHPLPPLGEIPVVGGGAQFCPGGHRVAYQVARSDPEHEKFWTIVLDIQSGQSRVVLQDEAVGYDLTFGHISGWLDDNTLVVGESWYNQSAIIDANSGALLRTARGEFMGYAVGIVSTVGFAAPGSQPTNTQCPGAPASRLQVNQRGRVTYTDGRPINIRQSPAGIKIGSQKEGAPFTVISGPTCTSGYTWWEVCFDSGLCGFVAEGEPGMYYLEPLP